MNPYETNTRKYCASLSRVARAPDFFDRSYGQFTGNSVDVPERYHNKDIPRINNKLKITLEMLSDNSGGEPGLGMYLELLGKVHACMHISTEHFTLWRKALIATAAECDPDFYSETQASGEGVSNELIAGMQEHERPPNDGTGRFVQ